MKKITFGVALITFAMIILSGCKKANQLPLAEDVQLLKGWDISSVPLNFNAIIRDMFFVDDMTGYVVGYNGSIYKTTDSGNSWQPQNSGTTLHLLSVYFINRDVGFASGRVMGGCLDEDCDKGAVLLKTNNGGETWKKLFFENYKDIYSLHFFDEDTGLAVARSPVGTSEKSHVARTTDGGKNWTFLNIDIYPDYTGKLYSRGDVIYVTGKNQEIFESEDKGETWRTINAPVGANYFVSNLYFYDEDIAYINSISAIYKTKNGGNAWSKTDFPFDGFGIFHFYSEDEGFNIINVSDYVGGDFPSYQGDISYQTFDGGKTWQESPMIQSNILGYSFAVSKELVYVINGANFITIKKK